MFKTIPRVAVLSIARKTVFTLLLAYGVLTTTLLLKLKPEPVLIGIDQYGTRVIRESNDRLLKKEKQNFIKHFFVLLYNFDQDTFEKRISESGDFMTEALWASKSKEFEQIAKQFKSEGLTQIGEIQELRELEDGVYQADISVKVHRKLTETTIKLRVEIKIRPNRRRQANPYPYEVERYDEQQVS